MPWDVLRPFATAPRTACEIAAMTAETITAAAAGTWTLGELAVNRVGFGAMRLTDAELAGLDVLQARCVGDE